MLLAQRKKRQQLAGKIGHNDEEYQIGGQPNAGQAPTNRPSRSPRRVNEMAPDWMRLQYLQPKEQQQNHQQQQQQYQQPSQWMPQQISPNYSPYVNISPPQYNAGNFNNINHDYQKPINFPSALPPLHGAPILPSPGLVNRSPMRFPSALSGGGGFNSPPPLQYNLPSPVVSPPRGNNDINNMNNNNNNNNNNIYSNQPSNYRPQSRASDGVVSSVPRGDDDPAMARRRAREKAIEIQRENARLCEERRLQQELEKRIEAEEERRREDLAKEQRNKIGQMEREEMNRERYRGDDKVTGRKSVNAMNNNNNNNNNNNSNESQLRQDLMRQIEDKKRRAEEETRKRNEEDRKQDDIARQQREIIAQKEKEEMDRERNQFENKMLGRKGTQVSDSLETQSQSNFIQNNLPPRPESILSSSSTNKTITESKENQLSSPGPLLPQSTLFLQPAFTVATPRFEFTPQSYNPAPFSHEAFSAIPSFNPPAPLFPSGDLLPSPAFEQMIKTNNNNNNNNNNNTLFTGRAVTAPGKSEISAWTAPRNSPMRDERPATTETGRLESQLRDMITNHGNIQRMLESEVNRKPGEAVLQGPLPPITPITQPFNNNNNNNSNVGSSLMDAALLPGDDAIRKCERDMFGGILGVGINNNYMNNNLGFPPVSGGILKKPGEISPGIAVLGVNLPMSAAGTQAATNTNINMSLTTGLDDISAEPSQFVVAKPLIAVKGIEL